MAYCRWSSDFYECDVYVYESVGDYWATHVAGRRRKAKCPDEIKKMPTTTPKEWVAQHSAMMDWLAEQPDDDDAWDALQGPHAGESYRDATPGDCAARLEEIRASGLNVPQYAIDELRAEQAEMDTQRTGT